MNLAERFERIKDTEYLKFERVEQKLSQRPDIHAFILIDKIMPSTGDIVAAAEHDIIFLDIDDEDKFNELVTDEQIIELCRCGVRFDSDGCGLAMFV